MLTLPDGTECSRKASVLTNVQSTVPQLETELHSWIASALTTEHQKLIAPTLNLCMDRMDKKKTLAMKRETTERTEREDG